MHTHKHMHIKQVLITIHKSGDTFTDSIEKLNHLQHNLIKLLKTDALLNYFFSG